MNGLSALFKGRYTLWGLALFFALLSGFGALTLLGSLADRGVVVQLTQDVAAGTPITAAMVTEVNVPASGVPTHALSLSLFGQGNPTQYAVGSLPAGTVLQAGMVDPKTTATAALEPGMVLSTIIVSPEDAVGGRVTAGSFIDIAAKSASGEQIAKIILQHVRVVDVNVSPQTIAGAAQQNNTAVGGGSNAQAVALYAGVPSMYLLALSPADFVKLALVREQKLYLALSASQTPAIMDVQASSASIFASGGVAPSSMLGLADATAATGTATNGTTPSPTPSPTATK